MSLFTLSQLIALLACCIGGGIGGLSLVHPQISLRQMGFAPDPGHPQPDHAISSARGLGGMMLLTHGAAAGLIGFRPELGNIFVLGLSLAWFGSAVGRTLSVLIERAGRGSDRWNPIILDLLMGLALTSPLWAQAPPVAGLSA